MTAVPGDDKVRIYFDERRQMVELSLPDAIGFAQSLVNSIKNSTVDYHGSQVPFTDLYTLKFYLKI